MVSILDVSHFSIGPCWPLEQLPFGNSSRHSVVASLTSMKVFGENAVGREGWRGVGVGGEAVRLSPKYWEKFDGHDDRVSRFTLYGAGFG